MLTNRQISILAYLHNKRDWITSEEISSNLSLNKKTIQLEIKSIMKILQNSCSILINKQKGYFLESLSENSKKLIYEEIIHYGGKYFSKFRPSLFIFYLSFLKSYITMQTLADSFYMSKSAVSLELETVKRWLKRYEGIELEISNKHGIKINAKEKNLRFYCSKFSVINVFKEMPFQREIAIEYEEYLKIVEEIVADVLIKFKYYLIGEEYYKICRFISISILRSRMGYVRNVENDSKLVMNPIVLDISELIKNKLFYAFEKEELLDLEEVFNESDVLFLENKIHPEIESRINILEKEICNFLNISNNFVFIEKKNLVQVIKNILLREERNHRGINYYNENIIKMFPLETYLIERFFFECFGIKIIKELSTLSLFLATSLEPYKNQISVLLVTNKNISIINHIKNLLNKYLEFNVKEIVVIPEYYFNKNLDGYKYFDVFLTTEQEILFTEKPFYFIEPISNSEEIKKLNLLVMEKIKIKFITNKINTTEKYLSEKMIKQEQLEKEIINCLINDSNKNTFVYSTFGNEKLYINNIDYNVDTKVVIYTFESPFEFKDKKIRKIIFSQFNKKESNIFEFYSSISDVLELNL